MAEVAGLVLGAVGIVGIIGAFKDSVDLLGLILDSRHLSQDFEILETKLSIQRLLLLVWSDRVGLLSPDYDRRLDNPNTQQVVFKILKYVAMLLKNSSELRQRYGLHEADSSDFAAENSRSLISDNAQLGDGRWTRFLTSYQALPSEQTPNGRPMPTARKIRWMIRDKQKFEGFIRELSEVTAKLNQVIPDAPAAPATQSMIWHDLEEIGNLRGLKVVLEASIGLQETITDFSRHALEERCKDQILNKLWFRKIDDRRDTIDLAHEKTLQWALEPSCGLSTWLRSSSGLYWVSGKAGSGKSTLMKHLYLSSSTRDLLSQWANGEKYSICDFFFKNLGTPEQKSQEGLSRTLLFQILSTNRDLISEALPHMWKELYDTSYINQPNDVSLPSQAETKYAFNYIGNSYRQIGRVCFLIDGLDEFVGDYSDGINFVKQLAANNFIKVIVSSRPDPSCAAAFKALESLQMQDLNRKDISIYVNDTIRGHTYMRDIIQRSAIEGERIVADLIDKSSGVFLWVVLACRSLLSGFDHTEDIQELRHRVNELPPKLADMFEHMLRKIDIRHRSQGARLLKICYTHQTAQWPDASPDISAVGLALIDMHGTDTEMIGPLSTLAMNDLCLRLEGRLRSRCGGLLEISKGGISDHSVFTNVRVLFMHRTIFEFLNNELVWNMDCLHIPHDENFDPNTALSLYGLHMAKQKLHVIIDHRIIEQVASCLWEGLRWAVIADSQQHGNPKAFFQGLSAITDDRELTGLSNTSNSLRSLYAQAIEQRHHSQLQLPLRLAIEAGAFNYVREHPGLPSLVQHSRSDCSGRSCKPLLLHAVQRQILDASFRTSMLSEAHADDFPFGTIIDLLLDSGCDPNEDLGHFPSGQTPWKIVLGQIDLDFPNYNKYGLEKKAKLIERFIRAGADVQVLRSRKLKWEPRKREVLLQYLSETTFMSSDASLSISPLTSTLKALQWREIQPPLPSTNQTDTSSAVVENTLPMNQQQRSSGMKTMISWIRKKRKHDK